MKKRVCIVIPAYNEEKNIADCIEEIKRLYCDYDVIVVDDGSTDQTRKTAKLKGGIVLPLSSNLGIGGAVQAGFLYALTKGYDIVIRMDSDGQHDPRYIDDLYAGIDDGANIVIGSRYIDRAGFQSTACRRLGGSIISLLLVMLCGKRIKDPTSGYWAIDKKALSVLSQFYQQDYPEPEAILTSVTFGLVIKEVPVIMRDRSHGKSSINIWRSIYYMIKVSLSLLFAKFSKRENHDIC